MPDIEKVIKGISCCRNTITENLDSNPNACIECPYAENGNACSPWALFDDAIELIKSLQAQLQNTKERLEEAENRLNRIVYCKDCKHFDDPNKCHVAKMCRDAGVDRFLLRDWNWYCGDGEGK